MYGYREEKEKMGGMTWEIGIDIYTLLMLCIKQITNENLLYGLYSVLCSDLNRKEIQKKSNICICIADFPVAQVVKNPSAMQDTQV